MALKVDRVQLEIDIKHDSARKRLRELEDNIRSVKSELTKASKANDTKTYQELTKRHRTLISEYDTIIEKIGVNNMSLRELRQRHRDLSAVFRNMPPTHEAYKATREELDRINSRMKELRGTAKETGTSLSKFGMSFQVMLGNLMTKGVQKLAEWVSSAKEFIIEGMNVADKAEGIVTAFNKLNAPDLLKNMRTETKGLISDFQIMQTAVRADKFGIPLNKLGSLLKFAQQRAQETGDSIDYLVDSIINGIGRKSPLILDNLGIAASRLQEQTKITGDFTAAAISIVNEELEKQGDLALTSADKVTQTAVKWENAQLKIGQRFQWLGTIWNTISGNMADTISELAGDTRTATQVFDDQIEKVADLELNINPLAKRYDELKSKVIRNADEQSELTRIMNTISGTIPGVITEFDKYGNILSINTQKVYDYIASEEARLQFLNKEAIDGLRKQREELLKEKKLQETISQEGSYVFSSGGMFGGSSSSLDNSPETLQKAAERVQELGRTLQGIDAELARLEGKTAEEQLNTQKKVIENRQKFTAMNAKELKTWINDEKNANDEYLALAKTIYGQRVGGGGGDDPNPPSSTNKNSEETNAIDNEILAKKNKLKQSYIDNLIDFESYNKEMERLEMESLVRKMGIADLEPERIEQINQQILDLKLKAKDKELKAEEDKVKKQLEIEKQNKGAIKKAIDEALQQEVSAEQRKVIELMDLRRKNEISEKEYQRRMLDLHAEMLEKKLKIEGLTQEQIDSILKELYQNEINRYSDLKNSRNEVLGAYDIYQNVKDQLDKIDESLESGAITYQEAMRARVMVFMDGIGNSVQQIGGNLSNAMTEMQSAEESAITRKYDKQIKAAEGNSKKQKKLEEKKEAELNKVRAEYADKQFVVQAAQITSETAMAAMRAYSALAGIPVVGPALGAAAAAAAILYGASQLKVANEQRQAAKEGYQVGGYTPTDNRDDKPVGTVHANEFVANANAVRNPSVRKFLDVFDMAQKNGTIHLLNTTQILEKVRSEKGAGFQSGGYTPPDPVNQVDPSVLLNIIERNTEAMNKMKEKLDEGIEAYSVISGDYGSYRQTQRYEGLLRNASRR